MGTTAHAPFRQMDAIGTDRSRQRIVRRIAHGDEKTNANRAGETPQPARQHGAFRRSETIMAQDDGGAARQPRHRRARIGQALVVGEQNQRRQTAAPASGSQIETPRVIC